MSKYSKFDIDDNDDNNDNKDDDLAITIAQLFLRYSRAKHDMCDAVFLSKNRSRYFSSDRYWRSFIKEQDKLQEYTVQGVQRSII